MKKVRSGDPDWIHASGCLANGLYYGEGSNYTLIRANLHGTWMDTLPSHTEEILRLEASGVPIMTACTLPFVDPKDEDYIKEFVEDYKEFVKALVPRALKALGAVEDPSLQYAKKSCETRLKDAGLF